ncbi:MAG: metal-dependent hydrolase [Oligoflexus sp.]|nr:metal-dependent hydrolase [Oligoflexus sp.]
MYKNSITIRRLLLRFPKGSDPLIIPNQPEESYLYIGLSLLLPYLEPYLVRSMLSAKTIIQDEGLVKDMEAFMGQESQHHKLHIQFNCSLDLSKYEGLKELEEKLAADYNRFSDTKSLRFNLAFAEGFEAFTLAMTRSSFQTGMFERIQSEARDLFRWHLMEEIEHRTVAFDVYQQISGAYFYRVCIGIFAQWHLCRFVFRVSRLMLRTEEKNCPKKFGGRWRSFQRQGYLLWLFVLYFFPKLLNTYMPWYSPYRIAMPEAALAMAKEFTERARSGAKLP